MHMLIRTTSTIDTPRELLNADRARLSAYATMLRHRILRKGGTYEVPEDALRLSADAVITEEVRHVAQRLFSTELRFVVVVGIGGSNLGSEAVYDAIYGAHDHLEERMPKLLVLDTISDTAFRGVSEALLRSVHKEEFAILIVSKSGTTTETIANATTLVSLLTEKFSDILSRVVAITDKGSPLFIWAEKEHVTTLTIPEKVGGRWSVFSSVGLLPLLLTGIDVSSLQKGATEFALTATEADPMQDPALRLAFALVAANRAGAHILDLFLFDPDLESLGKWTRQLFAESLGKDRDTEGRVVTGGLSPVVTIGSTDLHSVAQLNLAGPRDKVTIFVRAPKAVSIKISKSNLANLAGGIAGKNSDIIMGAIIQGTIAAYAARRLPIADIEFTKGITPDGIGAYMTLMMATVMYMAEIMHLNAFDQPAVEEYKRETRRILNGA